MMSENSTLEGGFKCLLKDLNLTSEEELFYLLNDPSVDSLLVTQLKEMEKSVYHG